MSGALPSASGMWIADACPLSPRLGGQREATPDMLHGIEAHALIERAAALTSPAALDLDPVEDEALRAQLHAWWEWRWSPEVVAWWPPGTGEREVGVALDVEACTARRIPPRHPETGYAAANLSPTEVACTLDLAMGPGADGVAEVVDWKTTTATEPRARPGWGRQVAIYSAAWSLLHEGCDVRRRVVQVGPDGADERPAEVVGEFEALGVVAELRELRRLAFAPEAPEPRPGMHCSMCPGAGRCPAAREAAELAVTKAAPPAVASANAQYELGRPVDAAHAAWLLERVALAERFLQGVLAEVRGWVSEQPGGVVELPNGRTVGFERQEGDRYLDFTVPGAFAALAEIVGAERADRVAVRRASLKSVELAVRAALFEGGGKLPRGSIKRAEEDANVRLQSAGVLKRHAAALAWFNRQTKGTHPALVESKLAASVASGGKRGGS